MRRNWLCLILAAFTTLLAGREAVGQAAVYDVPGIAVVDSSEIQVIKLADGSTIIGRIVAVNDTSVDIQTQSSRMTVPRSHIRSVTKRPVSALRNGEYWVPNPNSSRLLFGPTARMLKKGEGYVAAFELVFLGGAMGVTDNITMGGGFLLPAPGTVYFLTPKIGFSPSPTVHVAAGAMMIGLTGESETIGVYYGASTIGSDDASITGGVGYGYSGSDVAGEPVVMLGGEKRVSNRIGFVTENYFVPRLDPMVSLGVRFIGEKMSADLGLMRVADSGDSQILPMINFVVKF